MAPPRTTLGSTLPTALQGFGWLPVACGTATPSFGAGGTPVLIVIEDDAGQTHAPRPSAGTTLERWVCVGSVKSLAALIPLAQRGATMLNQDAPFLQLIRGIVDALGAAGAERPPRSASQLVELRLREAESRALAALTPAESDALRRLASGLTATEIARCTQRSLHTVRSQIKALLTKLDVSSQLLAVAIARRSAPAEWLERAEQITHFGDAPGPITARR